MCHFRESMYCPCGCCTNGGGVVLTCHSIDLELRVLLTSKCILCVPVLQINLHFPAQPQINATTNTYKEDTHACMFILYAVVLITILYDHICLLIKNGIHHAVA